MTPILSGLLLVAWPVLASGQGVFLLDELGNSTSVYPEGGIVHLRVVDPAARGVGRMELELRSLQAGDAEPLTVPEVGYSGVFELSIPLDPGGTPATDGRLQTASLAGPPATRDRIEADVFGLGTAAADLVGSQIRFADELGFTIEKQADALPIVLRVIDHRRGTPSTVDSFTIEVRSVEQPSISETVTMTETGTASGVFAGSASGSFGLGSIEAIYDDLDLGTSSSATASIEESVVTFVDAGERPVTGYPEGGLLFVKVADPSSDFSSDPETVIVDVDAFLTGDFRSVFLGETGASTGVFVGAIETSVSGEDVDALQVGNTSGPPVGYDTLNATYFGPSTSTFAGASTGGPSLRLRDAAGRDASRFAPGESVHVRVVDPKASDLPLRDEVTVDVSLPSGDGETLTLAENDFTSGVFDGAIELTSAKSASPGNGVLETVTFEELTVSYTDSIGVQLSELAFADGSNVAFLDTFEEPTDTYLVETTARLRVISPADNFSPFDLDFVSAEVTAQSGDRESLMLTETGVDTGVFTATLDLQSGPFFEFDGVLQTASGGERITATYLSLAHAFARVVPSRIEILDPAGEATSAAILGQLMTVRVSDLAADNPMAPDTVEVAVRAVGSDDDETLTLTETALPGIFEGTLATERETFSSDQDGTLSMIHGEHLRAVYAAANPATAEARATRSQVHFLDNQGEPTATVVAGATALLQVVSPTDDFSSEIDNLTVEASSLLSGDVAFVTLDETGPTTGVFEGSILITTEPVNFSDFELQASPTPGPAGQPDVVEARFTFGFTPGITVRARAELR